jgi:PilZ domain
MGAGVIAMSAPGIGRGLNVVDAVPPAGAPAAPPPAGTSDRRRQPRRCGVDEHGVQSARVRPGIDVRLIDVSSEGAAIETAYQLLPGRRLTLQLSFATCVLAVRSAVLRCVVSHASIDRIVYRGGLAFEQRLQWIVDTTGAAAGVLVE